MIGPASRLGKKDTNAATSTRLRRARIRPKYTSMGYVTAWNV
ncbi:MAG TPA: hypothetical protein PLT35_03445 [Vicinamibacterales bacterium]|nr:hypothetical protein [Vicinamibacterales bacterium]